MPHPFWALAFALLGSAILGTLGLIAGIWADKFDQLAAFQNFIIMPLTFLSGVFYSIHSLPPFWQALSHLNPFFYMIDGFRYGFFGLSDVSPAVSLGDRRRRAASALAALTLRAARARLEAAALKRPGYSTPWSRPNPSTPRSKPASPASTSRCAATASTSRRSSSRTAFDGLSRVEQHQLVYAALGDRMREEIHALSMTTLTPEEWASARRGSAAWTSWSIEGGAPLAARSRVSGAKNAALPILCAALLTPRAAAR